MRRLIVVVTTAILLISINILAVQKERVRTDGRPIYLELAPVDPRALMQGDYMDLRFQVVRKLSHNSRSLSQKGCLVLSLDKKNIGYFKRIDDGTPLDTGEVLLRYRLRNGRPFLMTNAFFFQEGDAQLYEAARYGELRVSEDGEAILVGLRDRTLRILGPDAKEQ